MRAALAVSPPRKVATSLGKTGTIMPTASMSRTMVIKMKASAARRAGLGAGSLVEVTPEMNQWRGLVASSGESALIGILH
jgi:hypothetical protein